jgi:prepilin-type N-terminal cleavage/methylation domain-containing protein
MLMIKGKSKGFTIIEIMLVLVIIAGLLYAIGRIYRMVDDSRRVNEAANQVLSVYQAAGQWYTTNSFTSGQSYISTFVDNGYLLDSYENSTADPWGGSITAVGNGSHQIIITLNNVPGRLCNNLKAKFQAMQNATMKTACPGTSSSGAFSMNFDMQLPLKAPSS